MFRIHYSNKKIIFPSSIFYLINIIILAINSPATNYPGDEKSRRPIVDDELSGDEFTVNHRLGLGTQRKIPN